MLIQIKRIQIIVFKDFEKKNLGEYHDLYVQTDTSWLAEVFHIFLNMCLEIYVLNPVSFCTWTAVESSLTRQK